MRNPNDEYDRLHDHMTAIARERDHGVQVIDALKERIGSLTYQIKDLEHDLEIAREALRREM